MLDISVIILSFNEERNLKDCLESAIPLSVPMFLVDSGSTDSTLSIASEYPVVVHHHPFENYAKQRNWALLNLPITTSWVLQMDADHRLTPELIAELKRIFTIGVAENVNGFMISRRTMFLGKWIKYGGHYPTYHAILFRKDKGECEDKNYDQHFVVQGSTQIMKGDMIDIITESLSTFTERHNKWSTLEAEEVIKNSIGLNRNLIKPNRLGNPIEQRRYMKSKYYSYPIFLRVFIYFFIRYFVKLGFLDGKTGLVFHLLQGFWFRFLVDCKIYELQLRAKQKMQ